MKLVKGFQEWRSQVLNEAKGDTYSYGCAMLYYDFPKMKSMHSKIGKEDIYSEEGDRTFGLETEPHITLLYGFHEEVDPKEVLDICSEIEYPTLVLYNASLFDNDDYDVLKLDVKSKFLHKINKKLSKFPHTTDYPDYHPHSTIGYLKKGRGQHYADLFNSKTFKIVPKKVVFSMPSGEKLSKKL